MRKILVKPTEDFFSKLIENSFLIYFISLNFREALLGVFAYVLSSEIVELVKFKIIERRYV